MSEYDAAHSLLAFLRTTRFADRFPVGDSASNQFAAVESVIRELMAPNGDSHMKQQGTKQDDNWRWPYTKP